MTPCLIESGKTCAGEDASPTMAVPPVAKVVWQALLALPSAVVRGPSAVRGDSSHHGAAPSTLEGARRRRRGRTPVAHARLVEIGRTRPASDTRE